MAVIERQRFNDGTLSTEKAVELGQVGYENTELDFKSTLDFQSSEHVQGLAKDVMGFANALGGYILIGADDDGTLKGLGEFYHNDAANVAQKLDRYCSPAPLFEYGEFNVSKNGTELKIALIHVRESGEIVVSKIDGQFIDSKGHQKKTFEKGDVFVRKGAKTDKAADEDYRLIIRRKQIDNAPTSETLSALVPTPSSLQNIPPPENQGFVGRDKQIRETISKLRGRSFIISIDGIGGVGKTALAHEVATRVWSGKMFDAVVWVSAKSRRLLLTGIADIVPSLTSFDNLLNQIAQVLGFPNVAGMPAAEKEAEIKRLLSKFNCLLVVDNLETVSDRRIYDFLQDLPQPTKALVTSRKRVTDVGVVRLEQMPFEDAVELIRADAEFKDARALKMADEKTLRQIYDTTGGIPLAIRWAVGWVALGDSVTHVIERFGQGKGPMLPFCFDETYNHMLTAEAKRLLCIMPIFGKEPNREELSAASGLKGDNLDDSITELVMLSLINEKPKGEPDGTTTVTYGMLPLTMAFAQGRLSEDRGLEKDARKRYARYLQVHKAIEEASAQYGYTLEDLGATTESGRAAALLANLAFAAYQRGSYDDAVRLFQRAVETNARLSYVYQVWAMVERQEGNYGRANELFEEANRLNPGNPVVLRAWARMKAETGAIEESRKLAQEGLEAAPDDPANLHNLAVTESQAGNYEKANQLLEKATYPSPVSPQQERQNLMTFGAKAENFRRWGVTLLNQAKLPEAREKLSLGMEAATNGLRINTSEWKLKEIQIRLFLNLGEVVLRQGDLPGAEKLLRKAFFYNPQTPWQFRHNSDACLALARCLRELGLTEEAVRYCQMGLRAWPGNETLRRFYETLPRKK